MTQITCSFVKRDVVVGFLDQVGVLKPDVSLDVISIEPSEPTDVVCLARSSTESPFFYMYACLFLDLHASLPFDNLMVGVLRALNVAHTQLHPNIWASIQAFRLICDVFRLSPTPSIFLSYYTSHPAKLALWQSLVGRLGNVLFGSFVTSYNNFKEKFLKVFIRPEGVKYFFNEAGQSKFPLSWTSKPIKFKEWPCPPSSVEEEEIYSLFDGLPLNFLRGS